MLSKAERTVIQREGYFLDVQVDSQWQPAYILMAGNRSLRVALSVTKGKGTIRVMKFSPSVCHPVFTRSRVSQDGPNFNNFIQHLCASLHPSQVFLVMPRTDEDQSNEQLIQLHICHLLMISRFAESHSQVILEKLSYLVQLWTDFIATKKRKRGATVAFLWRHFCRNVKFTLNRLLDTHAGQVCNILLEENYFEKVITLLENENLVFDCADLMLLEDFPKYLSRNLDCYVKESVPDHIQDFWRSIHQDQNDYCLYLMAFEPILSDQGSKGVDLFCKHIIILLLTHSSVAIQESGLSLLWRANGRKLTYVNLCFESPEFIRAFCRLEVDPMLCFQMVEILTDFSEERLCILLEAGSPDSVNLASPALLSVMIEKRNWRVVEYLAILGFRFSHLKAAYELVDIIQHSVYQQIPVDLFQVLVDIAHKPVPQVYTQIYKNYPYLQQMRMLSALSFCHLSEIDKIHNIGYANETIEMIRLHSVPAERLKSLWIIERLQFLERLPRVLWRSIVSEFAYNRK